MSQQQIISRSSGRLHLPTLPNSNRALGSLFEKISCKYLTQKGFHFIKKNWKCALGEIDLIFSTPDQITYILIEVKARRFQSDYSVKASIDCTKRSQLYRVAEVYARPIIQKNKEIRFRIDTIRIVYAHKDETLQFSLEHIQSAINHAYTFEKKKWGQNRSFRQEKTVFRKNYSR